MHVSLRPVALPPLIAHDENLFRPTTHRYTSHMEIHFINAGYRQVQVDSKKNRPRPTTLPGG